RAEVDVGELSLASARAPLDGEHDEVEREDGLYLAPARAPPAGLVGCGERFRDHALVTELEHPIQKRLRLARVAADDAVDEPCRSHEALERRSTLRVRPVEQIDAVHVEHVEEEDRWPRCPRRRR